ncbi:MAG: hypothetical protein ABI569_16710 [Casimicrobiaceae bacterium]
MHHYGISAIHWNANLDDFDEVMLHKFVRHEHVGAFAIKGGEPTWCADVVGLIRGGDMVWVLVSVGGDRYQNTDHVGVNVKRGQRAYLYSCRRDGTPTDALARLPRYWSADDAPPTLTDDVGRSARRTNLS